MANITDIDARIDNIFEKEDEGHSPAYTHTPITNYTS